MFKRRNRKTLTLRHTESGQMVTLAPNADGWVVIPPGRWATTHDIIGMRIRGIQMSGIERDKDRRITLAHNTFEHVSLI